MSLAIPDPVGGAEAPFLSVILPTDTPARIEPVLERLRRQTIARRLEVVLIMPASAGIATPCRDEAAFAAIRRVSVWSIFPLAEAQMAGIREATAPWVFLGETHSYPQPGWAEALLAAATSGAWDAMAAGMENANPGSSASWASFLADYARWGAHLPPGEVAEVPINNALYRRDILLALGDRLVGMLSHSDALSLALRAQGCRALHVPAARLGHVNLDRPAPALWESFVAGTSIGAHRAGRWPWWRRGVYAGGAVFIPLVLMRRMWPAVRQATGRTRVPAATFFMIFLLTCAKSVGEFLGYLGLRRLSHQRALEDFEIRKLDYLAGSR